MTLHVFFLSKDITGTDVDRSRFFLESSNWNLEVALGSFYETGDADVDIAEPPSARPNAEPPSARPNADEEVEPEPAAAAPKPSPARRDVGNIRTLESDDDEDSDMVTVSFLDYFSLLLFPYVYKFITFSFVL